MEWGIVAVIAVAVLIAGAKLPDFARNVGRSHSEFRKAMHGETDDSE